jgi:RNA polymerase sigma factor (sigma-70 family)
MHNENISDLFMRHEQMINSRAQEYSSKYSMDFEEAKSKALEVFMKIIDDYNPDFGKFGTYLYSSLQSIGHDLMKEIDRGDKHVSMDQEIDEDGHTYHDCLFQQYNEFSEYEFTEAIDCLDDDCKKILSHLFDGTFEAGKGNASAPGKRLIEAHVKKNWGWKRERVLSALDRVKNWCSLELELV